MRRSTRAPCPALTDADAAEVKALRKENDELRRAVGVFRTAGARPPTEVSGGFQWTTQHPEVLEVVMARAGHGRKRPERAPLQAQRRRYAELIAESVSNSEACRIVGVNQRTGPRWRYGRRLRGPDGVDRKYAPMIHDTKAEPSPRYLSDDERDLIAERVRAGASLRAIAREFGWAPSTISREVRRNRHKAGSYRPVSRDSGDSG